MMAGEPATNRHPRRRAPKGRRPAAFARETMEIILAGDIGGTNTRLALYEAGNLAEPLLLRSYRSGGYESLQSILELFMEEGGGVLGGAGPGRAGFGIAGPAEAEMVKPINLPWPVERQKVARGLDCGKVTFLNDFSANCLAVPRLGAGELHQIGGGSPLAESPIAVLGAGTGLGEGFLLRPESEYLVVPSEGGHTDFAPCDPLQIRLLQYLTGRFGRVSYERVLSGPGLVNLYEFLRESEKEAESAGVRGAMENEEPAAVICREGLTGGDSLCEKALALFCAIYGAEAGNMALKCLTSGGVYLAGGIAPRIIPKLEEGGFRDGFEQKGRYSRFLRSIPTYVITHPNPGLLGAAIAASRL